ncbi:MAG TPA: GPW/gp25 family protein [Ignavibacteriaceae bacterium]
MGPNQSGQVQKRIVTRRPYFVGFNTVDQRNPPYSLTNIELVKRDINNHFATSMGSRVMLPNFGTRIFELLFDPFDEYTKNAIIEDAVRVISEEPRVQLVNVDVFQEDQALTVALELLFRPESITESMFITFSRKDKEAF